MLLLDYEPRQTARGKWLRLRARVVDLRDLWLLLILLALMLASFNL